MTQTSLNKESARRKALEKKQGLEEIVEGLERKLGVEDRWSEGSKEWGIVTQYVATRAYHKALSSLEGLVVFRLFELTKLNMSGLGVDYTRPMLTSDKYSCFRAPGYKLRVLITTALKSRSKAIQNALKNYNKAARAMDPPQRTLEWKEVVEYAFLADFDLLRDCRGHIQDKPWARQIVCDVMNDCMKVKRAVEELDRLNIEIRRFWTAMHDEQHNLERHIVELNQTDVYLSHQVSHLRDSCARINDVHRARLRKLAALPGFTGVLTCGLRLGQSDESMDIDASEVIAEADDESRDSEESDSGSTADGDDEVNEDRIDLVDVTSSMQ